MNHVLKDLQLKNCHVLKLVFFFPFLGGWEDPYMKFHTSSFLSLQLKKQKFSATVSFQEGLEDTPFKVSIHVIHTVHIANIKAIFFSFIQQTFVQKTS